MAIPLILGAAVVAGVGAACDGAGKAKKANDTMKDVRQQHEEILEKLEKNNKLCTADMDKLGRKELEILQSFEKFSDAIEKIKNRPQFKNTIDGNIKLPEYNGEELKQVWVGANVLLGALGGAAAGTAGGFAASGAAVAAVISFGTASTGTAISTLSGAAMANATLAALGGGTLAAGGGGVAAGTMVLGATTLGVGLLVGGVIFNFTGRKLSAKAEESRKQVEKEREQAEQICDYLKRLEQTANRYRRSLEEVEKIYYEHLNELVQMVDVRHRTEWKFLTAREKKMVENTVLLVNLLHEMCKVKLVEEATEKDALNTINTEEVERMIGQSRIAADELLSA